jgi:hypothetical protein
MGYSISQETHERIERYRAEGRLCQGSGRCSQRGTKVAVCLLHDTDPPMVWRVSCFVVCAKHAKQMEEWPAFTNGAMLYTRALGRTEDATIVVEHLTATPHTLEDVGNAEHRMRVDEAKRRALEASR